jgi:hypothetical protein
MKDKLRRQVHPLPLFTADEKKLKTICFSPFPPELAVAAVVILPFPQRWGTVLTHATRAEAPWTHAQGYTCVTDCLPSC